MEKRQNECVVKVPFFYIYIFYLPPRSSFRWPRHKRETKNKCCLSAQNKSKNEYKKTKNRRRTYKNMSKNRSPSDKKCVVFAFSLLLKQRRGSEKWNRTMALNSDTQLGCWDIGNTGSQVLDPNTKRTPYNLL